MRTVDGVPSLRLPLIALALLFAACTSEGEVWQSTPDSIVESTSTTSIATTSTTTTSTTTTLLDQDSDTSDEGADSTTSNDVAAAVPNAEFDQNAATSNPASAWISRRSMSAEAIELVWSAEADVASFEIHRLQVASDAHPQTTEMTDENRIHSSPETGVFLDEDVEEGTRYWYGVRGLDEEGTVVATGWHRADAVTDDEPPSPVELTVTLENGVVNLSWTPPDENYELHAYRVLRAVDGAELETVVTTWNPDQTSFVDDQPPAGNVVYAVEVIDFHWNPSDLTTVNVDVGS